MTTDSQQSQHRGRKILAAGLTGLALATIAWMALWYYPSCSSWEMGLVEQAASRNPPWMLLSGLAAAPVLLLLWFWRDQHRERDLAAKERANKIARDRQRREQLVAAFSDVSESSESRMSLGLLVLDQLVRDEPRFRTEIKEYLTRRHGELQKNQGFPTAVKKAMNILHTLEGYARGAFQELKQKQDEEGETKNE